MQKLLTRHPTETSGAADVKRRPSDSMSGSLVATTHMRAHAGAPYTAMPSSRAEAMEISGYQNACKRSGSPPAMVLICGMILNRA